MCFSIFDQLVNDDLTKHLLLHSQKFLVIPNIRIQDELQNTKATVLTTNVGRQPDDIVRSTMGHIRGIVVTSGAFAFVV